MTTIDINLKLARKKTGYNVSGTVASHGGRDALTLLAVAVHQMLTHWGCPDAMFLRELASVEATPSEGTILDMLAVTEQQQEADQ